MIIYWYNCIFYKKYIRFGDHLEAEKKAGYKDTHTLRNQACKLRREWADEITDELKGNFAEIATRALNIYSFVKHSFMIVIIDLFCWNEMNVPISFHLKYYFEW